MSMRNVVNSGTMARLLGAWLVLLVLMASCSTVPPTAPRIVGEPSPYSSEDYALGAEDTVEVQVWKNPDLSRTVTVRPDGKISLPLVGDIQAAGLTAMQITDMVTEKLKAYYKDPAQVTVIVHQVNSYSIYVLGEVRGQGKHLVRSGTTFLQAIALVGGFTPFAATNKILLRRRANDGQESAMTIRYKDVLAGTQANLVLRPGDTIVVP